MVAWKLMRVLAFRKRLKHIYNCKEMILLNNFVQELIAERIGGKNFGKGDVLYKFEKIKRAKQKARAEHPEIELIDLGVGEPDAMADPEVVNVLSSEAAIWENRGYTDNGCNELKKAAAEYLASVYSVRDIDWNEEIVHSIGSKPALAMIPQAFINPGDYTLLTVPGYPIIGTMTEWLGGKVYQLSLKEENQFLPDLTNIPSEVLEKAKILYINYPNNPTGASASKEFFEEVIKFARKNNILVVQDAAYAALTFDGELPLSFLTIEGAKEVGIEIHSMSKAFNMTGWRMAFLAGNNLAIQAFSSVKDNNDSGQFKAIQLAAKYALEHTDITKETALKYSRRHNLLVECMRRLGFKVQKPKASFYLYTKIPKGIRGKYVFNSAEDFSQYLIREKLISTVPWDDVGAYIRLSVTFLAANENEEKVVIDEVYNRLKDADFIF